MIFDTFGENRNFFFEHIPSCSCSAYSSRNCTCNVGTLHYVVFEILQARSGYSQIKMSTYGTLILKEIIFNIRITVWAHANCRSIFKYYNSFKSPLKNWAAPKFFLNFVMVCNCAMCILHLAEKEGPKLQKVFWRLRSVII